LWGRSISVVGGECVVFADGDCWSCRVWVLHRRIFVEGERSSRILELVGWEGSRSGRCRVGLGGCAGCRLWGSLLEAGSGSLTF
jgi:hypothetical protein